MRGAVTKSPWLSVLGVRDWLVLIAVHGLFAVIVFGFFVTNLWEQRARAEWLEAIRTATQVRLEGRLVEDPAFLLRMLAGVGHVRGHHSTMTHLIHVELCSGTKTTRFIVSRDSQRPTEFWVMRPGPNVFGQPQGQEAGGITSSELDVFLRERGF